MKIWNKYLVLRRDNSVPEWPYLVLGAADPSAAAAIRALSSDARNRGKDPEYCDDLLRLADNFEAWLSTNPEGDPDAPPHRKDDPLVVSRFKRGSQTI